MTYGVALCFLKERLAVSINGKLDNHYWDIIENFLHKIVLYIGYVMHLVAQNLRIKEIIVISHGNIILNHWFHNEIWREMSKRILIRALRGILYIF